MKLIHFLLPLVLVLICSPIRLLASNTCDSHLDFDYFGIPPVMATDQKLLERKLGFDGPGDLLLLSTNPGDPLKYSEKRSIRLLTSEQMAAYNITPSILKKLYGDDNPDSYYIFANFIHGKKAEKESRFWIAIIPTFTQITNIYIHLEWFVEGAGAHLQYQMKLSHPITLIPQGEMLADNWVDEVAQAQNWNGTRSLDYEGPMQIAGDFVYTLLALRSEKGPQQWGPIEGLTSVFANGYSFQSTLHTAEDQIHRNWVEVIELEIPNQPIAKEILKYSIDSSHFRQEKEIYNTVFNSCVTAVMNALFARGKGYDIDPQMFNPYRIIEHLTARGYIKNRYIPSLNEQYSGTIVREDINQEVAAQVNQALPIIQTERFDLFAREVAAYIAKNRWQHQEISGLFGVFKSVPQGANLEEAIESMDMYLETLPLSQARKQEIQALALGLFAFIVQKLGSVNSQVAELVMTLTRQR